MDNIIEEIKLETCEGRPAYHRAASRNGGTEAVVITPYPWAVKRPPISVLLDRLRTLEEAVNPYTE